MSERQSMGKWASERYGDLGKIVGLGYFSNLNRIRNMIESVRNGGMQENPEVLIVKSEGGLCHYDRCEHKEFPADSAVVFLYGDPIMKGDVAIYERKEVTSFHKFCLDNLAKDERFSMAN